MNGTFKRNNKYYKLYDQNNKHIKIICEHCLHISSHINLCKSIYRLTATQKIYIKYIKYTLYIGNFDATIIPFHYIYFWFLLQIQACTHFCRRIGHFVFIFCSIRFGSIERWWITVICCRNNKIQSDEFINESERKTVIVVLVQRSSSYQSTDFSSILILYIQCI